MNNLNMNNRNSTAFLTPTECPNNGYPQNYNDQELYSIALPNDDYISLQIIDENGKLITESIKDFKVPDDKKMKVVSIFGNSGDGKSYFLNHLLFRGHNVFKTSPNPGDGTRGVWGAYHDSLKILCLDTQPLNYLESSNILLMKVLALSDVAIFIARSERLPKDLYKFLGEASKALNENFKRVLQEDEEQFRNSVCVRGPSIIICHESTYSPALNGDKSVKDDIKGELKNIGLNIDGLGEIHYIPLKQANNAGFSIAPSQVFTNVNLQLKKILENTALRIERSLDDIFKPLKALCERFQGRLTCDISCDICRAVCKLTVGHENEGENHFSADKCRYVQQHDNKEQMCLKCDAKVTVIKENEDTLYGYISSTWNGYKLNCPKCGVIYNSREHWFGNQYPENNVVYPKFIHVWPGNNFNHNDVSSGFRRALEAVGNLANTAYNVSNDFIAPKYWQPNSEITECNVCKCKLGVVSGDIHHCRDCGKGVCDECSKTRLCVPKRGWTTPVRVCNECHAPNYQGCEGKSEDITPRKVSEKILDVIKPVVVALSLPGEKITDFVRPPYWTPDSEALICAICEKNFGVIKRHHCRRCGNCVCHECSPHKEAVPERNWNEPTRVCNNCAKGATSEKKSDC